MGKEWLEDVLKDDRAEYQGQEFRNLPARMKGHMIRAFSEGYHPKEYPMLLPTGEVGGPVLMDDKITPAKLGWQVTDPMLENAISILEDGSPANLSRALGKQHKVPSFANNMSNPWDGRSTTIDTHAVGAGHLLPLSGNAPEVIYAMGGVERKPIGIGGGNPLYTQAYKDGAQELSRRDPSKPATLGLQLQSISWEAIRSLFTPAQKNDEKFVAHARELWQAHRTGDKSLDWVYNQILDTVPKDKRPASGPIPEPDWASHYTRPARR
jgi:hypothetical protein